VVLEWKRSGDSFGMEEERSGGGLGMQEERRAAVLECTSCHVSQLPRFTTNS
jgi:hypothetical protein